MFFQLFMCELIEARRCIYASLTCVGIGSGNGLSPVRRCWLIFNWTLRNKLQWNVNQSFNVFIEENAFENVICITAAILSWPQCVNDESALVYESDITWMVRCLVSLATSVFFFVFFLNYSGKQNKKVIWAMHNHPFVQETHWQPSDSPCQGPAAWNIYPCCDDITFKGLCDLVKHAVSPFANIDKKLHRFYRGWWNYFSIPKL